jgi:FkbM family methyltransferase
MTWLKRQIVAILIGAFSLTTVQAAVINGLLGTPRLRSRYVQSQSPYLIDTTPRVNNLVSSSTFLNRRRNPVAVDAGANFGCFALAFAQCGAVVHAFEPQPLIAGLLTDSVKLNNATSIMVHNSALGRSMGSVRVPTVDYSRKADFGMVQLNNSEGHSVALVTLDSLELSQLDLIKIDVEGMEVDVLAGARWTIARCGPVIFIEHWLSNHAVLEREIRDLNYDILVRTSQDWLCVTAMRKAQSPPARSSGRSSSGGSAW